MQNQPLLDVLTREGVLISVSVRYWRAAKKLKPEDLGLDPDDITDRLISLGHKKLLPREALAPFAIIESRAHALVEACAFPFLNGLGHFLPNTKLEEVTGRLRELEREFIGAQAAFMRSYAQLRRLILSKTTSVSQKSKKTSGIPAGSPNSGFGISSTRCMAS